MAVSITEQQTPLGSKVVKDTSVNSTAVNNVTGSSGSIYLIEIVNGATTAIHFKIYDHASPTIGTTAPNLVVPVPASSSVSVASTSGIVFGTAISYACVTEAGTAGVTDPNSTVSASLVTT